MRGASGPWPRRVSLRVRDLSPGLAFYRDLLGLEVMEEAEGRIDLSATRGAHPLVRLEEAPEAPRSSPRAAGLFHLALRVPDRRALARVLAGFRDAGVRLQGLSDHGVSEALYLSDPHGNGLEIYADRPREEWEWQEGQVHMVTRPLDVASLLGELEGQEDRGVNEGGPLLPAATDLGHVHLKVTSLQGAEAFYSGVLGFPVTTRSYPGALFFGAGGYHHHVGVNVWSSQGGPPRREGALGLGEVALVTPDPGLPEELVGRARRKGFPAALEEGGAALQDGDGLLVWVAVEPGTASF